MNLVPLDDLNKICFRSAPRPPDELRRWCRNQVLPARKIGGKWFVDLDALVQPAKPAGGQDPDALARAILAGLRAPGAH